MGVSPFIIVFPTRRLLHAASPVSAEVKAVPAAGPTHSQSIDELASILAASSADKQPDKDTISTAASASEQHGKQPGREEASSSENESSASKGNVKHFWQRKQDTAVAKPAAGKSRDSASEDAKAKPAKEKAQKKAESSKKAELPSQKKVESSQKKVEPIGQKKAELPSQKKAESNQKKVEASQKKVNQKAEALLTQKKAESPKPKKVEAISQESKLFRLQKKSHERSKSESPERSKGRKDHHGAQGGEEAASGGGAMGEETQINVLDRIKHYNIKDSAVQQTAAAGGGGKTTGVQSQEVPAKGKPAKGKPAKGDKAKGKEEGRSKVKEEGRSKVKTADKDRGKKIKDKDKDGDKKKQDKKAAKKDHWRLFKKHKTTDGSKDGTGKKGKKSHDEKKTDPQQPRAEEASAQMFPGVKNRIDKLRELGLETDGDGTDDGVILLSVQQQGEGEYVQPGSEGEESEDGSSTTSEWTNESETDDIDEEDEEDEEIVFGEADTEVRLLSPEARASSLEDLTSSLEIRRSSQQQDAPPATGDGDGGASETASERNVKDTVKKLQEMQMSMESKHRPRFFTDAKRYIQNTNRYVHRHQKVCT